MLTPDLLQIVSMDRFSPPLMPTTRFDMFGASISVSTAHLLAASSASLSLVKLLSKPLRLSCSLANQVAALVECAEEIT